MKKLVTLLTSVVLFSALTFSVSAKALSEDNINISEPQSENLYLAGENIVISADVEKDIVAAGEKILIEEDVMVGGNLFLTGGEIQIKGQVMGDIVAAGGTVFISGNTGDDIRAAGFNVVVNSEMVGGDLVLAGSNLTIDPDTIVGGEEMLASSNVNYASNIQTVEDLQDFDNAGLLAGIGAVFAVGLAFTAILTIIGGYLLNYLILRLFPVFSTSVVETLENSTLNSFLVGILVFVAAPFVSFILLVSVIGIPILTFLALLAVVVYVVAQAITTYYVGYTVLKYGFKRGYGRALNLLVGSILLFLVGFIPAFGSLIKWLIVLTGAGAIAMNKYQSVKVMRKV